jgi:hypothetical protein
MSDLLLLTGELTATYVVSAAVAFVFGQIRSMHHQFQPYVGCRVRLRGKTQTYLCHLDAVNGNQWTLSPPLVRDRFYPLCQGEQVIGEVKIGNGNLLFRTEIAVADSFRGRIWLKPPKRTYWREFRAP